ncbi:MAG: phosphatase PAP2 family protein [Anaerolineae bacterium]
MGGIEAWGIEVILRLQALGGPAADAIFRLITFLGDEKFYLLLLPFVYWCLDKRLGLGLGLLVLGSNTANQWLKHLFGLPRPPSPPVRHIVQEADFGFPSGHTQAVTVAFGYLAVRLQRLWVHVVAAVLVLLVGLSRLYLGVHYPHDVLGGLAAGMVLLWVFVKAWPLGASLWQRLNRPLRYALALLVPAVAVVLWPLDEAASSLGALAGFGVGAVLEATTLGFGSDGPWRHRLARLLLGTALVFGFYAGLKAILPQGSVWRFVRYGAIGLTVSLVGPWLFVRLGLAAGRLDAARAEMVS